MWIASLILLLVSVHPAARAVTAAKPCFAPEIDFSGNDVPAPPTYVIQLRQLLQQEKFRELDCIANTARSGKQRVPGGMWKLHEFYWAMCTQPGHATQEDWKNQLKWTQDWVAARPFSITARVVQAESYVNYAWYARGTDTGDSVTDSGWKLFGQRLQKAKAILDEASKLKSKCPEWYTAMQDIAIGSGWNHAQAEDLLKKAVAFEPEYYYYYRNLAHYLMPQWNGQDGDAAKFAAESADHVGGEAGDILYFQIGEKIVCACNQPEYAHMSWPRLQKGYALLEKKYGVSLSNLNKLAVMATKSGDLATAGDAFERIGDNWDKEAWITETYFNQMKAWATQVSDAEARSRAILKEAAANLQSPGGDQYQKSVEATLAPFLRKCAENSNHDMAQFELVIKVGQDGGTEDGWFRQPTPMAQCIMREIYDTHVRKETPFPVPPHAAYWVDLHLDPASANTAAAK